MLFCGLMCEKVTMTNCFVPNPLSTVKVHKGLGLVMKPAVTGRVWVVSVLSISSVNTNAVDIHTTSLYTFWHLRLGDNSVTVCKVYIHAYGLVCSLNLPPGYMNVCFCTWFVCVCMLCAVGKGDSQTHGTWQVCKQVPETPEPQCLCVYVYMSVLVGSYVDLLTATPVTGCWLSILLFLPA